MGREKQKKGRLKGQNAEIRAIKRVKRELGWNKLKINDWRSHPDLKDCNKLEDIAPLVRSRLSASFSSRNLHVLVLTQQQRDHIRYCSRRVTELQQEIDQLEHKVSSLKMMIADREEYLRLIECEDSEEDDLQMFTFKFARNDEESTEEDALSSAETRRPKSVKKKKTIPEELLSDKQFRRLVLQTMLVTDLMVAIVNDKVREMNIFAEHGLRVESLRKEYSEKRILSAKDKNTIATLITEFKHQKDEYKRQEEQKNLPNLAAATVQAFFKAHPDRSRKHVTSSTLLSYFREYNKHGGFLEDRRGRWKRDCLLDLFPSLKEDILNFVRYTNHVTVNRVRSFIDTRMTEHLDSLEADTKDALLRDVSAHGIKIAKGVTLWTAHQWMLKVGCKFEPVRQCYYTDSHNREDVVAYREDEYIVQRERLSVMQPLWLLTDKEGKRKEIHVDRLDDKVFVEVREKAPLGGGVTSEFKASQALNAKPQCKVGHDPEVCKCGNLIYHVGQDESIFKTSACPKKEWHANGYSKLRKKGEGSGLMVSAFVDEERGFGFPLNDVERARINESRISRGKAPVGISDTNPTGSPGLVFFKHGTGAGRDGFWDCTKLLAQTDDFRDCFEVLYPDRQLAIELDWSSGHTKMAENSLVASKMNANWGGKQPVMRATKIAPGCLGVHAPKLEVGSIQSLIFKAGERPFYEPRVEGQEEDLTKFLNKPKGLKQILYERGLWVSGMVLKDMREIIGKCPDFASEMSIIHQAIHEHGHILLLSPKCHPELAGVGIEYCWGKAKQHFRREFVNTSAKDLPERIKVCLSEEVLPLGRVRRMARKTRTYLGVYGLMKVERAKADGKLTEEEALKLASAAAGAGNNLEGFQALEKFTKTFKSHRNISDIDVSGINDCCY